jgi:hypothetical protein
LDRVRPDTPLTFPVQRVAYSVCMRRRKQPDPRRAGRAKSAGTPRLVIPPNTDATFEILRRRKRPLSKPGLQARAHEAVTELIWATCRWSRGWTLGEYRFLVFSTSPSDKVQLYVQFWSEPQEAVLWEVSSGRWNPPADKVMAGAPTQYVERLGFEIGGQAENLQREIWVRRQRDAAQAARVVLDIFYDAFGYRGLTSIAGELCSDSRGELQRIHHSFTPEDLCKTATRLGWAPRLHENANDDEDAVVIDLRRGAARAQIVLSAPVPGLRLYGSAFVDVGDPLPADVAGTREALAQTSALPGDAPMRVGRTFYFAGGVTANWLLTQVRAALSMTRTVRPGPPQRVH